MIRWTLPSGPADAAAVPVAPGLTLPMAMQARFTRLLVMNTRSVEPLRTMPRGALSLALHGFNIMLANQMVQDLETRLIVGWGIGLMWLGYVLFSGRSPRAKQMRAV